VSRSFLTGLAAWAVVQAGFAADARADTITLHLDFHFGSDPASGGVSITFDDGGSPGTVDVLMDTTGLGDPDEFLTKWYFSFDGDATTLGVSNVDASDATATAFSKTATQSQQADGDGRYNFLVTFQTGAGAGRFQRDEQFGFRLTAAGITAGDFDLIAAVGGGHGPFYSAAKVQGTGVGAGGSDWLGATSGGEPPAPVPEPGTLALLGAALAGLARRRRAARARPRATMVRSL